MQRKLLGIINVDFNTSQLLITDKKWEYNEGVCLLLIDFKKSYDSFKGEVLCNIIIKFGIPV